MQSFKFIGLLKDFYNFRRECPTRCARDEQNGEDGNQCWQEIMDKELNCMEVLKKGMYDCHCSCGGWYSFIEEGEVFLSSAVTSDGSNL